VNAQDESYAIASRHNAAVRRLRDAATGRADDAIFVEGVRLVREVLQCNTPIDLVAYPRGAEERREIAELLDALRPEAKRVVCLREDVFRFVAQTDTPQGILLRAARPKSAAFGLKPFPTLATIAHGVQDPGNLGTIVRTAEAAGCGAVFTTPGTANPFGAKALRASMGSALRMPFETGVPLSRLLKALRARGLRAACATVNGELAYTDVDWTQSHALILSREAGESDDARALADIRVYVPMAPSVESLNVSAAAAAILFEAARQRRTSPPSSPLPPR